MESAAFSLWIAWFILVAANFTIQLMYFFRSRNGGLYIIKRILTPSLLLWGAMMTAIASHGFPLVPTVILLVMGVGEIGIEGSSVVEQRGKAPANKKFNTMIVTVAGLLFLLVNLFLGGYLLWRNAGFFTMWPGGALVLLLTVLLMVGLIMQVVIRVRRPARTLRMQMLVYSIGIMVLSFGSLVGLVSDFGHVGLAGLILSISDTLVLIRLGSAWRKEIPAERQLMLIVLILLSLLYYGFMGVMINIAAPLAG